MQPTPVFLPGQSHGQRSLESYSPQGRKEPDTTEATEHAHTARMPSNWLLYPFDLHTSSFEHVLVFYHSKILRMHPSTSLIPALESAIPPRTRRPILFSGQWYLETKVWAQVCSLQLCYHCVLAFLGEKTGKEMYVYTHTHTQVVCVCIYKYVQCVYVYFCVCIYV